jgi:long-chain acyl-CoA synthetase
MAVQTINDIFAESLTKQRPAVQLFKKDDKWVGVTLQEFEEAVRRLSTQIRSLGVKKGDRVAILSENRPEWTQSDFAILAAGAVSVPIYATLLAHQIEYILNDSGSVLVIVSNDEQFEKIKSIKSHCPAIRSAIVMEPPADMPSYAMSWESALASGAEQEASEGRDRFDALRKESTPDDLATIVYTSGTTGNPKGAMLTHGNIASNVATGLPLLPVRTGDVAMNILPLTHILERMVDFCYFYVGATVAYAESVNHVAQNLQEVRPHVFVGVPRLFEKMKDRILNAVAEAPPARQKIFAWAMSVAEERMPYRMAGKPYPLGLGIKSAIAEKLVLGKIMERLGGRVRFVVSGGAPLSAELAAFFVGAGLDILEGYGLTETSPVITVNTLSHRKLGHVGRVIPGVEVKIAADGEILVRGPNIMKGYFNNPEATEQVIDKDGWFSTGDIGEFDADGFLRITDRKKDIIVNAYGKNIAPQPIENLLKTSPYIGTPVLIGDKRRFLSALIVPNFESLMRDVTTAGASVSSNEDLAKHPKAIEIVQKEIDHFNDNLDRQEKVRRFRLLPADFTIEGGEITPSLKVKRRVVDEKYKALIDEMYGDDATFSE